MSIFGFPIAISPPIFRGSLSSYWGTEIPGAVPDFEPWSAGGAVWVYDHAHDIWTNIRWYITVANIYIWCNHMYTHTLIYHRHESPPTHAQSVCPCRPRVMKWTRKFSWELNARKQRRHWSWSWTYIHLPYISFPNEGYIYLSFDQFYVKIQSPGSTVFLIYRMVFEYAEQSRWWKHCTLAPACAGNTGKEGKRWLWWFRQGFSVWLWLWQQPRVWWWKWGWRGGHPSSSSVGPSPSHRISAQGRSSWCWQGRAQGTPPEHWAQLGTTLPQSSLIYPNDETILNVYIEIDHLSKFDLFQLCICVLNSKGIIMWWTSQYVYQGQTKAAESMVDVRNINLEDARKRLAE